MAAQNRKAISVGPWGGNGGDSWDDGVNAGIRQIKLNMELNWINSIDIEYDWNGASFWSKHGGTGGNNIKKTCTIELDYPTERITSISGHYGTYVKSLTFESNVKKIYGPYGVEDGTYFSFSMAEGKIVGFHGRSSDYLDCIGVYILNLQAPAISKTISVGPWGGNGGDSWDDGVNSGIRQIILVHGSMIDSINIEYERNGAFVWSKHGGTGGNKNDKIKLNYPKERITSISGYYDSYDSCVSSLTFKSNEDKIYGPYGVEDGIPFSFSVAEGQQIVGFHGRSGWYLDCIGAYISNLQAPAISKTLKFKLFDSAPGGKGGDLFDDEGGDMWDDEGEDVWDDGVYSGIHQIIVVYDEDAIDSIHIEYDNNGSPFWLERGGSTVSKTKTEKIKLEDREEILKIGKIQLDYPKEILTSISGHYDTYLKSLAFESNLKKYGPYGSQRGTPFKCPISDCQIVGFYGRSRSNLDLKGRSGSYFYRIGVSLLPFPFPLKSVQGPWGKPRGERWDDGEYSGIHQILVVYNGDAICSIHIQYDNNGSLFWREHGGSTGNKIGKIQLDYPREFLTSISGRYDNKSMRSLTFKSNFKQYGPYGMEPGTAKAMEKLEPGTMEKFSSSNSDVKIVGFYGWSDEFLHCIGVHL